jgi:stage II sporulation protein D
MTPHLHIATVRELAVTAAGGPAAGRRARSSRVAETRAAAAVLLTAIVLACCGLAVWPAPAAQASEATLFNITGRGWGHGIGMSQYGAYGYAKAGWGYERILEHYYTGVKFGTTPNRTVRVLLCSGQVDARLTSAAAYKVTDGTTSKTIAGGTLATVTWTGTAYRVTAGSSSWVFATAVTFKPGTARLRLYNRNANGWPYDDDGARYRGSLRVVRSNSAFLIVNHVALEGYLRGVVPREMPSSWPQRALRAQACAARSYAVRGIKDLGAYDLFCTAASQVYNGYDGETAATNLAVSVTAGVVPTYNGTPIVAYFSSTSGGYTENIENVWGGSPVAYLKGVKDPYDYYSPYHVWTDAPYRWSTTTMTSKLGSLVDGTLRAVFVAERGVSPRVKLAYVLGTDGDTAHIASAASGWTLRNKLGLRDSWFSVRSMSVSPSADDAVRITYGDRILLEGRSYPTIPADKRITLEYYRDDVWSTTLVPLDRTVRKTFSFVYDGVTKSGTCVDYSFLGKPGRTTVYRFVYGTSRSPKTTIEVRPLVTAAYAPPAPLAGETVSFSGAVLPLTRVGSLIRLQRYQYDDAAAAWAWVTVVESTIGADGLYAMDWAAQAGTHQFRVTVPAGDQMVFGVSPTMTVVVE